MGLWRYTAFDRQQALHSGELAGETAADVRASLRRIGLQVVNLRLSRQSRSVHKNPTRLLAVAGKRLTERLHEHLRARRRRQRAELYDSLATMLNSGVPILEAIDCLSNSADNRPRQTRTMLLQVREQLRGGESFAQACAQQSAWFDAPELAMVEAGQHSGNLSSVLASLAERHERAGELGGKLAAALIYPFIVLIVGLGVAVFLSVKTLPDLLRILDDAKIPPPQLTMAVVACGNFIVDQWLFLVAAIVISALAALILPSFMQSHLAYFPVWLQRLLNWRPRLVRTLLVGGVAMRLAELLRSGVPMVESLRVIAPTAGSGALHNSLVDAADRVERGDELSAALDQPQWFDGEFRRLVEVGQTSGELDQVLQKMGERYQRQARRLIDRTAALLEPAVIIVLAVFVGTVVMAAILPLVRLKEVLG